MKRLDEGKVSLVDFMRSIKFEHPRPDRRKKVSSHFAHLEPHARQPQPASGEEELLVRSAN